MKSITGIYDREDKIIITNVLSEHYFQKFDQTTTKVCICSSLTSLINLVDQSQNFEYWEDYKRVPHKLLKKYIFKEGCDIILEYAAPMTLTQFKTIVKDTNQFPESYYDVRLRFRARLTNVTIQDFSQSTDELPLIIAIDQNDRLNCLSGVSECDIKTLSGLQILMKKERLSKKMIH